jgi:hypothetical protein
LPYPAFRRVNAERGGGKPSPYGGLALLFILCHAVRQPAPLILEVAAATGFGKSMGSFMAQKVL